MAYCSQSGAHRTTSGDCPSSVRTTQSIRSVAEPVDVRERAEAFIAALPADVVLSHVTAAQLWGLPLPRALEQQVALDVMRETTRGRIERQGCLSHTRR